MNMPANEVTKEQLLADFKVVMTDAEALLMATANQGGEEVARVRAKAEESLGRVKARMAEEQDALIVKTRNAAKAADTFVHENPWTAIGVAASVGLMIGLLSSRG
jgi:ElaB/YqjD/DUF883 family membrane-anchored ribosome-binding protein